MISIAQGLEAVLSVVHQHSRPDWMKVESVLLSQSLSRVLREDIVADDDSPRFDKAIRDGFAVRFEDLQPIPRILKVIGESRAGVGLGASVGHGECCEIMTGAPLPAGATAVVMIENTERPAPDSVRILKAVRAGEGLLRQGTEARKGDQLLTSGAQIGIAELGLLAGVGKADVRVSLRPRVGIVATGDELVAVDQVPASGQIRNSNSATLQAQCRLAGADPVIYGIARDTLDDLRDKIRRGLENDILLVSGGVSMGKYDLVEQVFAEFGIEIFFDKIAMKPGKPTVFGYREGTFVFGLPGNPISTMVSFYVFVRPVIQSLLKSASVTTKPLSAILEAPAKLDPERAALVPAKVRFEAGQYRIEVAPWKGSSDLAGLARANALIVIPCGDGMLAAGETADFFRIE
jgi:molybdopterin molybdotransferase